jgi:hypothetical protein
LVFAALAGLGTAVTACSGRIVGEATPDAGGAADDLEQEGEDSCEAEPCEIDSQCGCAAGEACDLDPDALATAGTVCRAADPDGLSDSRCTGDDECAVGYGCFGSPGQCRKYCTGDGDCGTGLCLIQIVYDAGGGEMEDVPGAVVCSKPCKPESADGSGCPDGLGCFFYHRDSGDQPWYTDCRAAGGGRHGADCSAGGDSDCAPGYNCLLISFSDGTERDECRQTCVWMSGGEPGGRDCEGGRTCNQLNDVVVGDNEYGSCG